MTLNVFADLHHADLYFSLHRLFEARLGWNLYRPIGLDWFHEGYWKIAEPYGNAMDTVGQYLAIANTGWDQYKNINGNHYVENDIYHTYDPGHDYYQKAITLEKFKSMKFDIVLSSIPRHDDTFPGLISKYQPTAKHISQMGNVRQTTRARNVMYTVPYAPTRDQNTCFYHQEIDPNLYKYVPIPTAKRIYSVVNLLPYAHLFNEYKNALPEVEFKAYGASCPDGSLPGAKGVSAKMQEANIGWHCKPLGGLGHSAMGWMASGRPIITRMSDHRGYGGSDCLRLFEPGVTCIDADHGGVTNNIGMIRRLLDPEVNARFAENAYKRFHEVINYDAEEQELRKFLERLV